MASPRATASGDTSNGFRVVWDSGDDAGHLNYAIRESRRFDQTPATDELQAKRSRSKLEGDVRCAERDYAHALSAGDTERAQRGALWEANFDLGGID